MTKNQSVQDPLNYGIRINNRLAFLMADQQRGDFPPTHQAEDFRGEVTQELEKELTDLNQLLSERLDKINAAVKAAGVEFLQLKTKRS